jgi:hypothetical protein
VVDRSQEQDGGGALSGTAAACRINAYALPGLRLRALLLGTLLVGLPLLRALVRPLGTALLAFAVLGHRLLALLIPIELNGLTAFAIIPPALGLVHILVRHCEAPFPTERTPPAEQCFSKACTSAYDVGICKDAKTTAARLRP